MAGDPWQQSNRALAMLATTVACFNPAGIRTYFLNHVSDYPGAPDVGIAPGGYGGLQGADAVEEMFGRVSLEGKIRFTKRINDILRPYLDRCMREGSSNVRPLDLVVVTDGRRMTDMEYALVSAARKLDLLGASPFQVGVHFLPVGDQKNANSALKTVQNKYHVERWMYGATFRNLFTWKSDIADTYEGQLINLLDGIASWVHIKPSMLKRVRDFLSRNDKSVAEGWQAVESAVTELPAPFSIR